MACAWVGLKRSSLWQAGPHDDAHFWIPHASSRAQSLNLADFEPGRSMIIARRRDPCAVARDGKWSCVLHTPYAHPTAAFSKQDAVVCASAIML